MNEPTECHCADCNPAAWWMIVCRKCGNKRCPHATHHLNECTGSNASGQAMEHQARPRVIAMGEAPMVKNGPTGIEARVCEDIAARQRVGLAKYGVSVEDSPDDMLRHAYHEALDLSVYLRAELERRDG